jgi:rhodanese-related sulfurtransferase
LYSFDKRDLKNRFILIKFKNKPNFPVNMPKKKKDSNNLIKVILISLIIGAVSGASASYLIKNLQTPTQEERIKDHYLTETSVLVSPHHIRKAMDKNDQTFILVDLRSQEEYEKEHITGAISIPAYKNKENSDYGAVDRIVSSFKDLEANNPNKEIIIYCYSIPCMTGRKVGAMLVQNDIYVKELGIGWNEWRYYWRLWNHEHEWLKTKVKDYVTSGSEPGTPIAKENSTACPIEGPFGC